MPMFQKIPSIQIKLMLIMAVCGLTAGITLCGYSVLSLRSVSTQAARSEALTQTSAIAAQVKAQLEIALNSARSAAATYVSVKHQGIWLSRQQASAMLQDTLSQSPQLKSIVTIWEPDVFDWKDNQHQGIDGYDESGRFIRCWVRSGEQLEELAVKDCDASPASEEYMQARETQAELLMEPRRVTVNGEALQTVRLVAPILIEGKFYGVVAVDVALSQLQELADTAQFFNGAGQIALTSRGQTLAAVSGRPELLGQPLAALHDDLETMDTALRSGVSDLQEDGNEIEMIQPVWVGSIANPWNVITTIPNQAIYADANQLMLRLILIAGVVSLLAMAGMYLFSRSIVIPLRKITAAAFDLAEGSLTEELPVLHKDEAGQLARAFNRVIQSLNDKIAAAERIAESDLTVEVQPTSPGDRLGLAMARMAGNMRAQVSQIAATAGELSEASHQMTTAAEEAGQATTQIAATIQQIARGVSQQTDSTANTAATTGQMEQAIHNVSRGAQQQNAAVEKSARLTGQINSAIHKINEAAQASAAAIHEAGQAASEGAQIMQETITAIDAIQSQVQVSAHKVSEMGERSNQIGTIVETIEDIAAQTNLLALNATIEAARAGQHGKGFAVVADEVRKLSERAAAATKQISTLVRDIRQTVGEAVRAMNQSTSEVQRGVETAATAGQKLEAIVTSSQHVDGQIGITLEMTGQILALAQDLVAATGSVSDVVKENTTAAAQMTASAAEVSKAIENIASISEENSAAVEEVSASAEEMSAQVQQVSAYALSLNEMAERLQQLFAAIRLNADETAQAETLPLAAD